MRPARKFIRRPSMAGFAGSNGRCWRLGWRSTICCPSCAGTAGPALPNQAVLLDLPHRRFYFFFIELWPQEVYYFTGLLIIAAMALFLMNALAGRIWCGYLCPQTIWTDLFYAVERWVEGDRRERILKDKRAWTFQPYARGRDQALPVADDRLVDRRRLGTVFRRCADTGEGSRHIAGAIHRLSLDRHSDGDHLCFAGHAREQVCIYMCPWPRIQAALTDEWALNVTYRRDRGEPRTSIKKAEQLRLAGEPAGDCVDCHQCINVCPTGVDIRNGIQLGCIQCGLCIDACDTIMQQINRPDRADRLRYRHQCASAGLPASRRSTA